MALTLRELVNLRSNVPIVPIDEINPEGGITIKGFASTDKPDRIGDVADPEQFDTAQFMAAPALLVNHDLWKTASGNKIGVGRPTALSPVQLIASRNVALWDIKDLKTGSIIDNFPKEKVPHLKEGDRGLFVKAEVTVPEVAKMVKKGELNSFSWRGLAKADYKVNQKDFTPERHLSSIDLFEISLVTMPMNPHSNFVVGKSVEVSEDRSILYALRLDKSRFDNINIVNEYLKMHDLSESNLKEEDTCFFCHQSNGDMVDLKNLTSVRMCEGVQAIVGPVKNLPDEHSPVDSATKSKLLKYFSEEQPMADEVKKPAEQVQQTPSFDVGAFAESVATKTAEAVSKAIAPSLDGLNTNFKSFGDSMTTFTNQLGEFVKSIPAAKAEEVKVVQKEETKAEEVSKSAEMQALAQTLADVQKNVAALTKGFEVALKAPLSGSQREEKIEAEKSVKQDANAVFNRVFGPMVHGGKIGN